MWKTTIDEIIKNYRDALVSIIPSLKKAHITYGPDEGYDAWDNISEAIFDHLVIEVITYTFDENSRQNFKLIDNPIKFTHNNNAGFINVKIPPPNRDNAYMAFQYFKNDRSVMDSVACLPFSNDFLLNQPDPIFVPFVEANFELIYVSNGKIKTVTGVEVED